MPLPASKGALLLLLASLGGLSLGEVGDFSHCLQYFYKGVPPQGVEGVGYQPICQRFKNRYHFASLYQRQRKVPLYSAYIFAAGPGKRPKMRWMYDPQLAHAGDSPEMKYFPHNKRVNQSVRNSQAVLQDYTNSSYTKGHLNPNLHQGNKMDREATFTLTNVVPQRKGSNSGPWAQLELEVKDLLSANCDGTAYVITGFMPYKTERKIKGRVAVPEYLWSAYCCSDYDASNPALNTAFPTYAAVGRNDKLSDEEIVKVDPNARASFLGYDVKRMPLHELESILQTRLGLNNFHLFFNQCMKAV